MLCQSAGVFIREMEYEDIHQLANVEDRARRDAPDAENWSWNDLAKLFAPRSLLHVLKTCNAWPKPILLVARYGVLNVGYAACDVLLATATIVLRRVFVDPTHRRKKIGTDLVNDIFGRLGGQYRRVVHYARETNLDGQLFLRTCEFKSVHPYVRSNYFDGTGESAYVLSYPGEEDDVQSIYADLPLAIQQRMRSVLPVL